MSTPTGALRTAMGCTRAQRCSPRPRAAVPVRSLLATALLLLGLLALNSDIGAAYATSPPPTVAKVKPGAGPGTGGTLVTIKGTNFTEATAVTFGSTDAASFTVKSATSITARSPAGTGTVDVTVTTTGGTSATSSADHFTYLPAVTAVSPRSGPVDGGTEVNITGVDLDGATAVTFGSTDAASFTVNSATSITAVSPAVAMPEKVHVRVTTPEGTSPATSTDTFKFTPTVSDVSPSAGPPAGGTTVTVTGTGFAVGETGTRITFGPRMAVSVDCATTTECVTTTPELLPGVRHIGTVDVKATVNKIKSLKTSADQFDYHGLYLRSFERRRRLPVGEELDLVETISPREFNECDARLHANITANGEATDEIYVSGVIFYINCLPYEWSGVLPAPYTLRINSDGTASIEGRMGVGKNTGGCVYEGEGMSGGFEIDRPFLVSLGGTFTRVEKPPGEECSETERVFMNLEEPNSSDLEIELVQ
ncbi:MAG: hypothetical protein E6G34_02235 [Actinobacteria bacterium]|nr:MAG: hypothetical protein E6G34_02235 [Actinomycetota bacterium]